MTNTPTNQSATARDIMKQFVTVLRRLVVITAIIIKVLPNCNKFERRSE